MTEACIQLPNGPISSLEARRIADLGLQHHLDLHHWIERSTGFSNVHMRVDVRGDDYNGVADARLVTDLYSKYPNIKTWRIRNEPNVESPGRNADDWYRYNCDLAEGTSDDIKLYIGAISPGITGWFDWFRASVKASAGFTGIDAHIYGNPNEFKQILDQIRSIYSGPLFVSEYNFGAGREYDLNKYAADWPQILSICNEYKVDICSVFIWEWVNPDSSLKTTVNVKNSPMELAIKQTPQSSANMRVALIPSNQDNNTDIVGGYANEMVQVAEFMSVLLAQAPATITAKLFTPQPESSDITELQSLHDVQKSVDAWQPDLAINVHTDSGYYSHTGTYSDGSDIIKKLCANLCPRLQQFFNGPCAQGNYYDYIFASIAAPAILLELGSHKIKADVETLKLNAAGIAYQIWTGVQMIFGNQTDVLKHLDFLWASANTMKETAKNLRLTSTDMNNQAALLDRDADASYERIIAIKKELGLQ
jgi:hypothetical protein